MSYRVQLLLTTYDHSCKKRLLQLMGYPSNDPNERHRPATNHKYFELGPQQQGTSRRHPTQQNSTNNSPTNQQEQHARGGTATPNVDDLS